MVYDDETGRRLFRSIPLGRRRRRPPQTPPPNDAVRRAILTVVEMYPRWGPKQVHAELRRTRHDISLAMIMSVMGTTARRNPLRRSSR